MDNLGLNEFFQPIGAPITGTPITALSIDSSYDNLIGAANLAAGAIPVPIQIGVSGQGAYVRLDGTANRIIVNDGTTNRIIIGSI